MFFSRKPTGLILVEREKAVLFPRGKTPPLAISTDMAEYLEVRDAGRLSAAVLDFAQKNRLSGQRLLLLLDKSIVFQKAATLAKDVDPAALKADFVSKMPFDPEDRRVVSLQQKDRLFLFGANQKFYHVLVTAFQQAGAKIPAVVPAVAYGVTDSDKLNPAKFSQIVQASGLTQTVNFLEQNKEVAG